MKVTIEIDAMNWVRVGFETINELVHGQKYLLAYNYGEWSYEIARWDEKKGRFFSGSHDLVYPKFFAKISIPKEVE